VKYSKVAVEEIIKEKNLGPARKVLSVVVRFGDREVANIYNTKLKYYNNSGTYYAYGKGADRISFEKEDIKRIRQTYLEENHIIVTSIIIGPTKGEDNA
jgi:hypothetical protein